MTASLKKISTREQLQTFWLKAILPALLFALFMVFIYPNTQWDVSISKLFFDMQQQQFVLKHQPFLSDWMHAKLKWLIVFIGLTSLILGVIAPKFRPLKSHRKSLIWVFVSMVSATSIVALVKRSSVHGCPWDLSMFGSDLPLLPLFANLPSGVEAGACFPAGHPSAGFALMAFYFAFRKSKPSFAFNMLWMGLTMGLLMGFAQVMRGAHFLSHVLWSGWLVWIVLLLLYVLWKPEN